MTTFRKATRRDVTQFLDLTDVKQEILMTRNRYTRRFVTQDISNNCYIDDTGRKFFSFSASK